MFSHFDRGEKSCSDMFLFGIFNSRFLASLEMTTFTELP